MNYYRIEALTTEKQLLDKETEWLVFENEIKDVSITYSYHYLRLFWQNYKDSTTIKELGVARQLLVLFLYKKNQLIAIFPFCKITRKRKKIFNVHSIEFIGQQFLSNYSDIITHGITSEDYEIAKKWLFAHVKFDMIYLSHIPDFTKNNISVYDKNLYPFSHSSEAVLLEDKTYEQYKKNKYSSNFKQNIRTLHNRIKKAGIEINIIHKLFEASDIDEIIRLAESKKESGKKNIYDDSRKKMFLSQLYQKYNAKISLVYFDKAKVAYLLKLYYKECTFWYDMSFNREYKQFWPGTLLLDYSVEESLHSKEFHVILGWGIDFIKQRFCNKFVEISNFVLKGNTFLSKIWYMEKKKHCKKITEIYRETIKNQQIYH